MSAALTLRFGCFGAFSFFGFDLSGFFELTDSDISVALLAVALVESMLPMDNAMLFVDQRNPS